MQLQGDIFPGDGRRRAAAGLGKGERMEKNLAEYRTSIIPFLSPKSSAFLHFDKKSYIASKVP